MVTNLCVLRSGGDFKPEHVQRLAKQVPELVCLSDVPVEGVKTIPLLYGWPGWWSKLEIFRPNIEGDVFYLDLDTLVQRMPAMPEVTTVLSDFRKQHLMASGLMFIKQEDKAAIWEAFTADPEKHMRECTKWPRWGDQGFLHDFLKDAQRWQKVIKVCSYKFHCKPDISNKWDVVCFHGQPRPWDIGL